MGEMDTHAIDQFIERVYAGLSAQDKPVVAGNEPWRLNEAEVYDLLDLLNLAHGPVELLPDGADAGVLERWSAAAADLIDDDGRILLKVVGRDILHKTEAGGVRVLKLEQDTGTQQLQDTALSMLETVAKEVGGAAVEGILACGFVPHHSNQPGQELLLSLRQDAAFGPVVVVGVGGTLTEWYGKGTGGNSRLIFPALNLDTKTVAGAIEAHPLLSLICRQSRLYTTAPLSTEQVTDAVMCLARLGEAYYSGSSGKWCIEEIEINPAVASAGALVALDGVGLVSTRKWTTTERPLQKINPLLRPHSAVVMGVSSKGHNPGRIILDNLKKSAGIPYDHLYVVHHQEQTIAGVPCFKSVAELPEKCDLAVVAIPAQGALDAIRELTENDQTESIILIPGGFAEAGQNDLANTIEEVLVDAHGKPGGGPIMVGGNCLGIVSRDQYNTFFLPDYKLPFRPGQGSNLALVSQSGAYLVTFASNYDGIIFPKTSISYGNQMDLTVSDFLAHFIADADVDVIACYVEGFRPGDGARFLEYARLARTRGKRVIIFKAGKTELGARAAASHTASLAGDYAIARSCLEAAGVTVAEQLNEFEDLIKTFTLLSCKPVAGRRVGAISNAGFECSTVMDQLAGLELATFDETTQTKLNAILPGFAHRENPIDCTPMTGTDAFAASTQAILDCPEVDVAIISSVPVTPSLDNLEPDLDGRHRENIYSDRSQPKQLIELMKLAPKPGVVVIDSGRIYDPMADMIEKAGIPVFRKIDRAARALTALCKS